uniref:Uncharacterized protein n=1 Tax=Aegilops tauschii TaxID=37682 RepID=R7W7Q2_AEGTA
MGNCQAADAAAVGIQPPGGGKGGGLPPVAHAVRGTPGHYVALVVLHHVDSEPGPAVAGERGGARITKIKLLKPKDTLLLGQVYRLITSQEVTKAVQTRKQERMRGCDEGLHAPRRPAAAPAEADGDDAATRQRRTEAACRPSGTEAAGEGPAPPRHHRRPRRRQRQRRALAAGAAEHHRVVVERTH